MKGDSNWLDELHGLLKSFAAGIIPDAQARVTELLIRNAYELVEAKRNWDSLVKRCAESPNSKAELIVWHRVEDGLPDIPRVVLAKGYYGVEQGVFRDGLWKADNQFGSYIGVVTHWAEWPKGST